MDTVNVNTLTLVLVILVTTDLNVLKHPCALILTVEIQRYVQDMVIVWTVFAHVRLVIMETNVICLHVLERISAMLVFAQELVIVLITIVVLVRVVTMETVPNISVMVYQVRTHPHAHLIQYVFLQIIVPVTMVTLVLIAVIFHVLELFNHNLAYVQEKEFVL